MRGCDTLSKFREEADQLIRPSGRPAMQVAREVGVPVKTLRLWMHREEIEEELRQGPIQGERDDLRRLRRQRRILLQEREIPK